MRDIAETFYRTLMSTQFLAPEKMAEYQRHLMEGLVRHARATTPFYRDTGRLNVLFRPDDTIDWSRWHEVPTFSRKDAQVHREALVAKRVPPQVGKIFSGATSGSTGEPFSHLHTELQAAGESALSERFYSWHQFDRSAPYARIKGSSRPDYGANGITGANWNLADASAPLHMLPIDATVDQQDAWLRRVDPKYLETFTNLADILFERYQPQIESVQLDTFINMGEILRDHLRHKLANIGIRAIDVYSSMEVGILAQECPHCGALHVASETSLLELIDDDGHAAAAGAAGRVIVTPFYSYAMPLIRYELGDRAIAARRDGKCPVTLPALKEIIGRERQPFILRNGSKRWLPLRSGLIDMVDYRQFQIVQTEIGRIELRVVSDLENPLKDPAGLDALITDWMTEPTSVDVVKVDAIPRQPNGKIQDVVSMVTPAGL